MTPRPLARTRRAAAGLVIAAGLLTLAGCDPRALLYFLQPFDPTIAPDGPTLKGKRIVVFTHAAKGTQNDFLSLDRDLTREVVKILRNNVKKIDVVDADKVKTWVDEHPATTDPGEVAEAFEADMTLFLEAERFQIHAPSDPGLFKGIAQVHVMLYELKYPTNSKNKVLKDKPKEAELVYETVRNTEFPNRFHMEMGPGVSAGGFKTKFLKLVATEISWSFVDHAPGDDIQDTKLTN